MAGWQEYGGFGRRRSSLGFGYRKYRIVVSDAAKFNVTSADPRLSPDGLQREVGRNRDVLSGLLVLFWSVFFAMLKSFASLFVVVVLMLQVGCGSSGRVAPEDRPPSQSVEESPQYVLGPGDVVRVNVWKNPDLSVEVPVRPDGFISVPLVGDVRAGGRTPSETAADTEQKLLQFIRSPQVSIIVTQLNSSEFANRVRVVGAVSKPVSIAHRVGMTVLDLVLEAGGLNEFASPQTAKLYRKTGEGTSIYPIYLKSIFEDGVLDSNFKLLPGDVVSVPERRF